jgi:hypothetical protein
MPQKITQEKITQIIELREFGCTFNDICKITKSSKRTVQRICNSNIKKLEYQPIKIPPNIKETQYSGYYVSEDGKVWTEFNRYTGKKDILREVSQHPRGGTNINDRYMSVNISIKDENGKFIKQIKYYTHRLIAETLIPNPEDYAEIDHIDRNKLNNHYTNLRWTTRFENMSSWERDDEYRKKLSENNRWTQNITLPI